jgi:hypothetical protein
MAAGKRKTPPRGRGREAPEEKKPAPESAAVALELFLTACQKSLARSVRTAQQSAKADNEFALGQRPIYMIDGIDMDVSTGVVVSVRPDEPGGERVLLDFQAPADTRSRIRFRVQSTPVELLKGAKLELANLDPLGTSAPVARMRVWLVDAMGRPVPNATINLHFARAGEKEPKHVIQAVSDSAGRVDFFVEPMTDEVKIVGDRDRKKVFLRSGGRGVNEDEYFVWATSDWKAEFGPAAEFSPPFPPQEIPVKDGQPTMLCSELHRLKIDLRR